MPVSYAFDPASGIVRVHCRDEVTLAEAILLLRALAADPATPASLDMLVDLRRTTGLPQRDELRAIANELARLESKLRWGACALVASSDPLYGVSRMFAVYAERSFDSLQVFREIGEGEAWLASARAERSHASGSAS